MAKIKTVRIVKTKYGTYALHYTNPDGRRRRLSVGSDQNLAQRIAVKFNDWLLEGKNPESEIKCAQQNEKAKSISIRDFFPIFMSRYGVLRRPTMQRSYRNSFKNICRCHELADLELGSTTKRIVLDYMNARCKQDKLHPSTVNNEVSMLKKMFSCAVEWDLLNDNPLRNLKLLQVTDKREVDITLEQAATLIKELPEYLANNVEFAIYSRFRKENVLGLRIEDLLFHDLTHTAQATVIVKGGRKEKLSLGSLAVEVLKRVIGIRKEGFVFINPKTGTRYYSIHKTFDKVVRKVGITVDGTKLRFHDLRHIFATWLHNAGVSLDLLRPLMGHRDRKTTDRYATIDKIVASEALNAMPRIRTNTQVDSFKSEKWQELASSV